MCLVKNPTYCDGTTIISSNGRTNAIPYPSLSVPPVIKLLTSANTYYQYGWLPLAGFIKATIYPLLGIATTITAGSFVKGVTYTIKTLGNTTQAQWLAAGVLPVELNDPADGTYAAVGVTFIAATTGTGTGTVTGRTEPWIQQVGVFNLNRIGKYSANVDNSGEIVTSTIGYTNVEKTYAMPSPTGSGGTIGGMWDIGMWDHWENMKFKYYGPISNFVSYTIQEGINNNIDSSLSDRFSSLYTLD